MTPAVMLAALQAGSAALQAYCSFEDPTSLIGPFNHCANGNSCTETSWTILGGNQGLDLGCKATASSHNCTLSSSWVHALQSETTAMCDIYGNCGGGYALVTVTSVFLPVNNWVSCTAGSGGASSAAVGKAFGTFDSLIHGL